MRPSELREALAPAAHGEAAAPLSAVAAERADRVLLQLFEPLKPVIIHEDEELDELDIMTFQGADIADIRVNFDDDGTHGHNNAMKNDETRAVESAINR